MNFYEVSSEEISIKNFNLATNIGTKPKFRFPPPPRLSKSANNSYSSTSDSSWSSSVSLQHYNRSFNLTKKKRKPKKKYVPPLGIYWDIENCQVPKNKSAVALVQKIRHIFLENHRESEFLVVCDVKKESPQVIQELHDAQVMLVHVSSTSKNAADEKLRQFLRRFGELHDAPATVILISGDINFASDLSDLRYRKKVRVVLIHNVNAADALILCANEHYSFSELIKDIPEYKPKFNPINSEGVFLTITNLPRNIEVIRLKNRLRFLTENCGGKIFKVNPFEGEAAIKFSNVDNALRAQRRIEGEDVFGNKIKVLSPSTRNYLGNKKNVDSLSQRSNLLPPPGFFKDNSKLLLQQKSNQQLEDAFTFMQRSSNVLPMDTNHEPQWYGKKNLQRNTATENILQGPMVQSRFHKSSISSDYTSDEQRLGYSSEPDLKSIQSNQPVNLIISNLDPNIDTKELKRLLMNMLKEYAMILHLSITTQTDGTPIANIKVSGQREAQFLISQLHRQKLGHKRIVISYAQRNSPYPEELRAMVVELLQNVPDKSMPLFKCIGLLESWYNCTVSTSELNKLKDVCKITDDMGPRIISLNPEIKFSPTSNISRTFAQYCTIHCPNGIQIRGWSELSTIQTSNIKVPLKKFGNRLFSLLQIHMGSMHLLSFQACYEHEFKEPLPIHDAGVPLEHLVTCIPNIKIQLVGPNKNIKIIKYEESKNDGTGNEKSEEDTFLKSLPPSLAPNITLLCRELVDLLKIQDRCQLLVTKFVPAYHHHFGKQCRVADYGYTKLIDLFESIPHLIQILHDGSKRTITLSHPAQMRRFTLDLLRVLKAQPCKEITFQEFPFAYEKVINKQFNAVEYGLCSLEDLLQKVPENTVVINTNDNGELVISVPKREQTPEEIMRTKKFVREVIDLLQHSPYYTMYFNKFIPAYHHHFGYQCKVSNYGFSRLIELFQAIPDVAKIEELSDGERIVSLTPHQALKVLGSQIVQLIRSSPSSSIPLSDLSEIYLREYGFPLKPQICDCDSLCEIIVKLSDYVQINNSINGLLLVAIDLDTQPHVLSIRCWGLLLKEPHCVDLKTFKYYYQSRYNCSFAMDDLQQIENVVSISLNNNNTFISLTPLYILAAQLYQLIFEHGGRIIFSEIEKLYKDFYGKPLKLSSYEIYSIDELYIHFKLIFFLKRKRGIVSLNKNLADHYIPLPSTMYKSNELANTNSRDGFSWPLPPPLEMVPTAKNVPLKPDTPPSEGAHSWSPSKYTSPKNLCIQMPIVQCPELLGDPNDLISPSRTVWNAWSPDPVELPNPDKLIRKEMNDSADSGVNIKLDHSDNDNRAGSNCKQLFTTFLNFDLQ